MGSVLQWILTLRIFSPVLRPVSRFVAGAIAVPLFRVCLRRMVRADRLNDELSKDLEQWVRGSLLLLLATANIDYALFGNENAVFKDLHSDFGKEYIWVSLGIRLLLAVGVIEAMPDQALFAIIHPGPSRLLFPKGKRIQAVKEQWWPFCKGVLCRHLDRSSSVFAIMAVIFGGAKHATVGWVFYFLAIAQFLIIGLVSSRDKALDVLSEFDRQMTARREALAQEQAPQPAKPVLAATPCPVELPASPPDRHGPALAESSAPAP